jgi:hypothetical protein
MLKLIRSPKFILLLGLIGLVVGPALFILPACHQFFDFSTTGQIGDTIGGLTAPIINATGAILVYLAFTEQVKANMLVQEQIQKQEINRKEDNESETLFEIYGYLVESIDNFRFSGFHEHELTATSHYHESIGNGERWSGSQAIYIMLDQIRCHYHGPDEQLDNKQEVAELIGILRIMELLIDRLIGSKNENKSILINLIEHQFRYRIMTRLKDCPLDDLAKSYCEGCKHEHGIPDALLSIFKHIDGSLKALTASQSQ